jgi:hypothetical protein
MAYVFIRYAPIGVAISDFEIEDAMTELRNKIKELKSEDGRHEMWCSTQLYFDAVRREIVQDRIRAEDVEFLTHDGISVAINKYGAIPYDAPSSIWGPGGTIAEDIIRGAMNKRRIENWPLTYNY